MVTTAALVALLEGTVTTFDGRPAPAYDGPHVIVTGPVNSPTARALPGRSRVHSEVWRLTCVNNNPAGARAIANKLITILDGTLLDGEPLRVIYQAAPFEDRDDPSQWRWVAHVEVQRSEGA